MRNHNRIVRYCTPPPRSARSWVTLGALGVLVIPLVPPGMAQEVPASPPANRDAEDSLQQLLEAMPEPSTPTRHALGVSADYMFGEGTVNLPSLFAIARSNPDQPFSPEINSGDRQSDYFGATLSYSYGQTWYFDLSYAHGSSEASTDIALPSIFFGDRMPVAFSLDDDWYQFYVRYQFRKLRGTRFSAYMRAGLSFVDASLEAANEAGSGVAAGSLYRQETEMSDLLGNLGLGGTVTLIQNPGSPFRLGFQLEAEGFAGGRSLDMTESRREAEDAHDEFDARMVYGFLGRGTFRLEYAFGRNQLLTGFLDAGMQVKYSLVDYEDRQIGQSSFEGGTFDELLWGPYTKLGIRYSF